MRISDWSSDVCSSDLLCGWTAVWCASSADRPATTPRRRIITTQQTSASAESQRLFVAPTAHVFVFRRSGRCRNHVTFDRRLLRSLHQRVDGQYTADRKSVG